MAAPQSGPVYFRSRVSPALTAFVFGSLVLSCLPMLLAGDLGAILLGAAVLVPSLALVAWIWVSTGYTVTDSHLLIRCAFFTWKLPLSAIRRVRPTRNPLTAPALSLDRLEIRFQDGRRSGFTLVSPADKEGFISLLRERCPQAEFH